MSRKTIRYMKYIDLKRSTIDEEKSNKKKGIYYFKEKHLLNYRDASVRPDFKLKFWRNAPYEIGTAIAEGWEFVTIKDPVYPDLAHLDSEGHWVFMDAVLMKTDLNAYLEARDDALQRSENAVKRQQGRFASEAARSGAKAYTQAEIDQLVSETKVKHIPDIGRVVK